MCFSIHITHSSVNFMWFTLLSQQKFDDRCLFKPEALFGLPPFWIASKQIIFTKNQFQTITFMEKNSEKMFFYPPPHLKSPLFIEWLLSIVPRKKILSQTHFLTIFGTIHLRQNSPYLLNYPHIWADIFQNSFGLNSRIIIVNKMTTISTEFYKNSNLVNLLCKINFFSSSNVESSISGLNSAEWCQKEEELAEI